MNKRSIDVVWKEHRKGNSISDEELARLLDHLDDIVVWLSELRDPRYHLFIADLQYEQQKLQSYKTERKKH